MKARKRAYSPEAIKRRNAAFEKLSPAQKRVVVAKDVLAALNARQLIARSNVYLTIDRFAPELQASPNYWELDAQSALLKGQVSCNVCAIGSIFVCAVERQDKITLNDFAGSKKNGMSEYLGDMFSAEQLDLMEAAFERTDEYVKSKRYRPLDDYEYPRCRSNEEQAELEEAIAFGDAYYYEDAVNEDDDVGAFDADGCMRAIMENIIANDGEFRP